ncbi:hypothetical protein Pan54_12900 [Rubinisphaera italica]|uniref:Uncharacterized protein n=1 Tax=Rubinisphaera italica TaxID=2527969 RepID=A0A5C5XC22_9PLAN|nr:hypothetical protein Pan54_12900 [Rubinisphaera italica]
MSKVLKCPANALKYMNRLADTEGLKTFNSHYEITIT